MDRDDQTGKETIVSVLTQYRVLKFIAINVGVHSSQTKSCGSSLLRSMSKCQGDCARLDQSIGSLGIGSYVSWYNPTLVSTSTGLSRSSAPNHDRNPDPAIPTTPLPGVSDLPILLSGDHPPTLRARSRSISRAASLADVPSASTPKKEVKAADRFGADRYFPLATATLQTSVFDVVHVFSERGISAIPIVDEDGMVINLYETVDIVVSFRS